MVLVGAMGVFGSPLVEEVFVPLGLCEFFVF